MSDQIKERYSDQELEEFRSLILQKLQKARNEYDALRASVEQDRRNGEDSSAKFNVQEDGPDFFQKAENQRMAQRQMDFIKKLEAALLRIDNKTYGICRVTGKLIPKERLRAVPHTTLSMEAKNK